MLVLTRKVNQQIRLGDNITVTILRVQGNSIRIGVEAPREVRVIRGELEPENPASESTGNANRENGTSEPGRQAASTKGNQPALMPTSDTSDRENKCSRAGISKMAGPQLAAQPSDQPRMIEFDLDGLDAETLGDLQAAADQSPETPCVYQMRTSAPLSRFVARSVSQHSDSYVG
jgi:carbon storage regulator CsrA